MMQASTTIIDYVLPVRRSRAMTYTRDIALVVLGSILLVLCSQIKFYLFSPYVPFSMQPFAVVLLGAALGKWRGATAVLLFLTEGVAGLPVFSNGGSVLYLLTQPTAGYLLSYPLAAFVIGWCCERRLDRHYRTSFLAMLPGMVVIYVVGVAWLSVWLHGNVLQAIMTGALPFLIGDVLKMVVASLLLPFSWSLVRRFRGETLRGEVF
ncbi:biotin transport system substrate-specific component [Thermosporothrix hazakensis]|uniref:Biotin transporter n=1 Tax=Thermosporothrix hazakensis TaxID=644383 RepID=A0A326UD38_THEHA|nr:biotin transporter BioY [Thermosporothrix hazakensis]PZW27081.1 biotin transport system substrate-specific component [Thermosporothrix hazakensis]GCE50366.1 biotin transporter BioY [Thermosporothrix hazakensis]